MTAPRRFAQVDVFSPAPGGGNPVAVVVDAEGLDDDAMQRFARWTNLSETTFLLPPDRPEADYRVRIFTTSRELPFAGHPTLGSCHAWLEAGGVPARAEVVVQSCVAGLVEVRRGEDGLAFAAPPLQRSGSVDPATRDEVLRCLQLGEDDVVDMAWADNGPGWVAVLLASAEAVLAVRPLHSELDVGVAGPCPAGDEADLEVRAFFPQGEAMLEDPVTGSLNASLAVWLLDAGRLDAPYVARQGTAIGRTGRIAISRDDLDVWVGGATTTLIAGTVDLG